MTILLISSLICIAVLIILIIGLNLQSTSNKVAQRRFTLMLFALILYLIANIVSEKIDTNVKITWLSFTFNILLFVIIDLITLLFVLYFISLIKESKNRKGKAVIIITIITIVSRIIVTVILGLLGKLFDVSTGSYVEKELIFVPYAIMFVVLVEIITIVILNRKVFTPRQITVIACYNILPLIAVIIELIINNYYLTGIALTLSLLMIYVLIQDTEFERNKLKANLLEEMSSKDFLTGMNNRRAYYKRIHTIQENVFVGVVYCDLNGLKFTNDNYGHAFGDELIKKFAEIFSNFFLSENTYRIAGDEFVALITDLTKDEFYTKVEEFKDIIKENKNIAATGYQYGLGKHLDKTISQAEGKMYENKVHTTAKRKAKSIE